MRRRSRTSPITIVEEPPDDPGRGLDRLHQRAFAAGRRGNRPMGDRAVPHRYARRNGRLVVARIRSRPIGYALAVPSLSERPDHARWYLEAIAVDPDHRRKGLGTSLLKSIAAVSCRAGAASLDGAPLIGEGEDERRAWMLAAGFLALDDQRLRLDLRPSGGSRS